MSKAAASKEAGESNLTQTAYHAIRHKIMTNQVTTGERLSACKLARTLHMSRTPVREALSILQNEGFVEIHNGVGFFVKVITGKDLAELVEVRAALECLALESNTLELDRDGLARLKDSWDSMKEQLLAGQKPDIEAIMELDYETHDFLVASSRNSYLIDLIKNISVRFRQVQFLSVMALNDARNTVEQHITLLATLSSGNMREAVRLLREHIEDANVYISSDGPYDADETLTGEQA
ncbi:GntR family transcriptional regulator [Desulfovibrio sp. OttesenSCG-928-I05]|nr:GntR family transcriptional regulator [Desulfovibrio sp. OttesenSCG-928-I05]